MSFDTNALIDRFGSDAVDLSLQEEAPVVHHQLAARGSVRAFYPEAVPYQAIRRLCALALCAPTKSDLQQRDIVIIDTPSLKAKIGALLSNGPLGQSWLTNVPNLVLFCGNNRRQRQLHAFRGKTFANDHLDAFFNSAVDAAISLSAFVIAAEAQGLGACPISAVRNHSEAISQLVGLPDYVFPVAGVAFGYPAEPSHQSMRLPLSVTLHHNWFQDTELEEAIDEYDRRRAAAQPYETQRYVQDFGLADEYGWSEDKARQYAHSERSDFGAYVRRIGFMLK